MMDGKNRIKLYDGLIMRAMLVLIAALIGVCMIAGISLEILRLTAPDEATFPDQPDTQMPSDNYPTYDPNASSEDVSTALIGHPRVLKETADAGQAYIDEMIFVGESTTAHLRSRGVLKGGTETQQVWSNASNTMMLDLNILQKTIRYPVSGVEMTIPQAAASAQPRYIVLSFGTNGVYNFAKDISYYKSVYGKLITAIHEASPGTIVLLQTVYPVAINQTAFSDATEVNGYIARLNEALPDIAEQYNAYVVDTASCLTNARGFLRDEYNDGDGLHLNAAAYREILQYLRTHACAH